MLKKRNKGSLDGDFVFLREVFVESEDVATSKRPGADGCEMLACKRRGGVSETYVFKREVDEREEKLCADMEVMERVLKTKRLCGKEE